MKSYLTLRLPRCPHCGSAHALPVAQGPDPGWPLSGVCPKTGGPVLVGLRLEGGVLTVVAEKGQGEAGAA